CIIPEPISRESIKTIGRGPGCEGCGIETGSLDSFDGSHRDDIFRSTLRIEDEGNRPVIPLTGNQFYPIVLKAYPLHPRLLGNLQSLFQQRAITFLNCQGQFYRAGHDVRGKPIEIRLLAYGKSCMAWCKYGQNRNRLVCPSSPSAYPPPGRRSA